jgi:hypothetical protein
MTPTTVLCLYEKLQELTAASYLHKKSDYIRGAKIPGARSP